LVFTAYLLKGGVTEKRLRTTVLHAASPAATPQSFTFNNPMNFNSGVAWTI